MKRENSGSIGGLLGKILVTLFLPLETPFNCCVRLVLDYRRWAIGPSPQQDYRMISLGFLLFFSNFWHLHVTFKYS